LIECAKGGVERIGKVEILSKKCGRSGLVDSFGGKMGLTNTANYCHIASVKTVTRNISLSEVLANFAVQEAEEGGYGNVSAYFAELVRQRRQAQIDVDLKFLADAIKDSPPGPEPVEKIVSACKAVRRTMRKENWGEK
jgi:hypothetical protein